MEKEISKKETKPSKKKKRPEIRIENRFKFNDKVYIVSKPIIFSVHHVSGGKGAMYAINKPMALSTENWPVNNWTDLEFEVFKLLDEIADKYSDMVERFKNPEHWETCKRYYQRAANV